MEVEEAVECDHGRDGGIGSDLWDDHRSIRHPKLHCDSSAQRSQDIKPPYNFVTKLRSKASAKSADNQHIENYISV